MDQDIIGISCSVHIEYSESLGNKVSKGQLPRHHYWHTYRGNGDHCHGAARLRGLHLVEVGVDGPEAGLEVVVVVVVPVVVCVDDDVAHVVE